MEVGNTALQLTARPSIASSLKGPERVWQSIVSVFLVAGPKTN